MYQDTKEKLHQSFDSVAPDLLSNIINADIHKIVSEEVLFSELEEKRNPSNKWMIQKLYRHASVAAVFICILTLFFYRTQSVEGTVTVECDYSTTMSLNHAGKIVRIDSDDSSQKMMDLCKAVKGKYLEEALQEVLKESNHENKTVCVIYEGKKKTDANRKVINDVTKRFTQDSGTDVISKEQSIDNSQMEFVDVAEEKEQEQFMVETEQTSMFEEKQNDFISENEETEETTTVVEDVIREQESVKEEVCPEEFAEEEIISEEEPEEKILTENTCSEDMINDEDLTVEKIKISEDAAITSEDIIQ